jgi:hypothetical protein
MRVTAVESRALCLYVAAAMSPDDAESQASGDADEIPSLGSAENAPDGPFPNEYADDGSPPELQEPAGEGGNALDDDSDTPTAEGIRGRGWGLLALWAVLVTVGLPVVVICLATLGRPHEGTDELLCLLGLAVVGVCTLLLLRSTIRYLRPGRSPVATCANCGRTLGAVPPPRCPRCGQPLEPDDIERQTLFSEGSGSGTPLWIRSDLTYAAAVGLCVGASALWAWLVRLESDDASLATLPVCAAWFGSVFLA